jgi:hypothetical protein
MLSRAQHYQLQLTLDLLEIEIQLSKLRFTSSFGFWAQIFKKTFGQVIG